VSRPGVGFKKKMTAFPRVKGAENDKKKSSSILMAWKDK
jgi:hypothetical protein